MIADLSDREKQIVRETMRMTADTIANSIEQLALDPRMKKVKGNIALTAAAISARKTSAAVWPWAT